jgi:hypothetical protein
MHSFVVVRRFDFGDPQDVGLKDINMRFGMGDIEILSYSHCSTPHLLSNIGKLMRKKVVFMKN